MTERLITNTFKTHNAQQFVESISEPANTIYYVFAGDHVSGNTTVVPNNSIQSTIIDSYNNMIFGKQITASDVKIMTNRNNWTGETVYDEYDHTDGELYNKNFFVVVNESSYYHVYKCLSNADGTVSTIQPTFSDTAADDMFYQTSDGYQWKYMYTVDSTTFNKFATTSYMPIVPNSNVSGNAISGAIDVIKVFSGGRRYDNYFASVFSATDIRVQSSQAYLSQYSTDLLYSLGDYKSTSNVAGTVAASSGGSNITGTSTSFVSDFKANEYVKIINASNTQQFEIKRISSITNNTLMTIAGTFSNSFSSAKLQQTYPYAASPNNHFYDGCWLVVTAGTGSGQYREIIDYYNDGGKKIAVLSSAFTTTPDATSQYEISPKVIVTGDGLETTNCDARALVTPASSNGVYAIEILNSGRGYNFAIANVKTSSVLSNVVSAELKPIIGPPGGHGADVYHELNGTSIGISVTFANSESNTISTDNDFSTIGILKDPKYANVELMMNKISTGAAGSDGTFSINERAHQFTGIKLAGYYTATSSSSTITSSGTDSELSASLSAGDFVVLNSGTNWQLANVSSVANATSMVVNSQITFSNSNTTIYKANLTSTGYISTVATAFVYASNVSGFFVQNRKMIGAISGAVANVTSVQINNVDKNSGVIVFNQLTHYSGSYVFGTFNEDEILYQSINGANTATARFHSTYEDGGITYLAVTNLVGKFDTDQNIVGADSVAVFNPITKYDGDLLKNSGEVIYLQNGDAVSRLSTQSETIKIIVEF